MKKIREEREKRERVGERKEPLRRKKEKREREKKYTLLSSSVTCEGLVEVFNVRVGGLYIMSATKELLP